MSVVSALETITVLLMQSKIILNLDQGPFIMTFWVFKHSFRVKCNATQKKKK